MPSKEKPVIRRDIKRSSSMNTPCLNNEHCNRSGASDGQTDVAQSGDSNDTNMMNVMHNSQHEQSLSPAYKVMRPHNGLIVWCMKTFAAVLVTLYFVIPLFIKLYPAVIVDVAFLNHFRWPPFINLSQPSDFGLNYTRTFHLKTEPELSIGVWHVLPLQLTSNLQDSKTILSSEEFNSLLRAGPPVILYLHGNTGTRAGWHRVQLYKVLSRTGYHVVTFDYRGYGDSDGAPSEDGLVHDAVTLFNWIKQHSANIPVFVWGHSLGSAVATKTAAYLCQQGANFQGLILESPFNNFIEAASNHPFSLPFRVMPWFSWVFIESIKLNNIQFASDDNIKSVTVPVMILHAFDDGVVPYELGRKLYDAALRRPSQSKVDFVTFDGEHGYGHKHIHKSPDLPNIVRDFVGRSCDDDSAAHRV